LAWVVVAAALAADQVVPVHAQRRRGGITTAMLIPENREQAFDREFRATGAIMVVLLVGASA